MKRQDQLLAHMDAYAVDRATNALLLQHEGKSLSASSKIVQSKLLAIDPTTKALLVKFRNQLPWQVLDPNPEFTTVKVGGGEFTTLKVGTGEDYTEFVSDGQMGLRGSAQTTIHLRPQLQQEEIRKWLTPDGVYIGIFYGFSMPIYAADNEELFFTERIPYRWNEASDIEAHVVVALAGAEDAGDRFKFQVSWEHCDAQEVGAIVPLTSNDLEVETIVEAGKIAQYSLYELNFPLDYDIGGAGQVHGGQLLAMRIRRIAAAAPQVTNEIIVLDVTTHYQRNKLGRSIAEPE